MTLRESPRGLSTRVPHLDWDELNFLEYLESDPVVEDYGTSHNYEVEQNDLRLLLTVWQYESVIQVSLFRVESNVSVFSFAVFVRGSARYVNDKRGRYLEFIDSVIAPTRFWYQHAGDVFDRDTFPQGLTIQLEVRPEIRVLLEPLVNS